MKAAASSRRRVIPFSFVVENLYPLQPVVRPMFGCFAVFLNNKIVFMLRHREDHPEVNGVWFATSRQHHPSLKSEFPSLKSVSVLGMGVTNWQMIHEDMPDFEEIILRACRLVVKGDPRIGHIPKRKQRTLAAGKGSAAHARA